MDSHSPADSDLLDGVLAGDATALQRIIDRYWDRLVEFGGRLSGCPDTAADIVQKALIRFWERRESWKAGSDPRLILYTLVRHEALNQIKADRARLRRTVRGSRVQRPVPTPADRLDETELIRVLVQALDQLTPRRREALILARFHDLKHAEVAELMGLTQRTVTNHISAALSELEEALKEYLSGTGSD